MRHRRNTEEQQRSYSEFLHLGKRVCRKMFRFLHCIFTSGSATSRRICSRTGSPVQYTATLDVCQPMPCHLVIDSRWCSLYPTTPRPMPFSSPAVYPDINVTMSSLCLCPPRSDMYGAIQRVASFAEHSGACHHVHHLLLDVEAFSPEGAHYEATE